MPGHPAQPVHVTARQEALLRGTKTPQRLAQRAQIVLLAAEARSSEHIVEHVAVTRPMVRKWRRRWSRAEEQLRAVEKEESDSAAQSRICEILADAPRSGRPADILPEQILEIVAIACEDPNTAQRRGCDYRWWRGNIERVRCQNWEAIPPEIYVGMVTTEGDLLKFNRLGIQGGEELESGWVYIREAYKEVGDFPALI